jgi:DNA ligase D-like protein (predicted 3'-phosphoesterase)
MSIDSYRASRDFGRSPEPKGGDPAPRDGPACFVIQEHDATSHHYDLRLEVDGVLRSWAVPKGPSTDPRERRLAIPTEDHPVEYADFEGVIPAGLYGAGTVLIWDRGIVSRFAEDDEGAAPLGKQLDSGHAKFVLAGEKLSGAYALTRIEDEAQDERWLLVKMDDGYADARRDPVATEPQSVVSGRTLEEITAEEG